MMAMLCLGGVAIAQGKSKVAVYVTGDVDPSFKKGLGPKMVSGITNSDKYVAIERTAEFLAEISKEQDYQASGAVNDNQIAKIGQQFGVSYVLVVEVSEMLESTFASARMIDVRTGMITTSTEAVRQILNANEVMDLADEIVAGILNKKIVSNTPQNTFSGTSSNMCFQGQSDAQMYYQGEGSLSGATWAVNLITSPLFGLIPAAMGASSNLKDSQMNYPNSELWKNSKYKRCYTEEALKKKKEKAWKAYGWSALVWSGIILLFGAAAAG